MSLKWNRPNGYSRHWSFVRFGRFGLFMCVSDLNGAGYADVEVRSYRHDDSSDDDCYSGPSKRIDMSSVADAQRRAVAWARSIGLAVPE